MLPLLDSVTNETTGTRVVTLQAATRRLPPDINPPMLDRRNGTSYLNFRVGSLTGKATAFSEPLRRGSLKAVIARSSRVRRGICPYF
jgi:hypothetical protein